MKDLHNNISIIRAICPIAVGTTGTGKTSSVIDLSGFEAAEIEFSYGAITATNAVFTALVTECTTSNGTFTSVADADFISTELLVGVAAAVRVDNSTKNITKRLGYIGSKQFLKAKVSSTVTAGTPIGVNVIRSHARDMPVT